MLGCIIKRVVCFVRTEEEPSRFLILTFKLNIENFRQEEAEICTAQRDL